MCTAHHVGINKQNGKKTQVKYKIIILLYKYGGRGRIKIDCMIYRMVTVPISKELANSFEMGTVTTL